MIAGWTAAAWTPMVQIEVPVRKVPVDLRKRYPTGEVIYTAGFRKPAADLGCIRDHRKPDSSTGYARARIGYELVYLHRYYWELRNGPIPDGYQIDHLCRNRWCINLKHLEAVTQEENIRRALPYRVKTYKKRNTQ